MGILSEDKFEELVGRLDVLGEETEQGEAAEEPEQIEAAEPDSSEDSVDVKEEEDGPSEDAEDVKEEVEAQADGPEAEAPKTPEHIPYGRFKEVNDKFRARDDDLQQAMQRIRELEQLTLAQAKQPDESKPEKTEDDWIDEIFGEQDDPSAKALKQIRDEMESVKQWQQQRTEQLVSTQLETEIKAAVEKNPDVKTEELWQAVAADGSVDVAKAAEYIQKHRDEMREQYMGEAKKEIEELKAKLAESERVAKEAPKFRRPSAAPSAPSAPEKEHRTVAEATNALAAAMRERMSF